MPPISVGAAPPRATIAILVEDRAWEEAIVDPAPLLRRAARAAVKVAALPPAPSLAVSIALIDDRAMRRLNRHFRGKDRSTNVLSFPAATEKPGGRRRALGDIALAFGTVRREAREQRKSVADHAAHLMVHGMLHLLGYDHESEKQANRMESLERKALAALGIGDPYRLPPQPRRVSGAR
jgi:probable rRNA maturation factor